MKNPIKILQISPGVPPLVGGVEKCTLIIYQKLNGSIFNVKILVKENKIYHQVKLPLIQCPFKGTPLNYFIAFITFLKAIKNADIVHFQYPNSIFPNITYGLIHLIICKILNKPYIFHIHLFLKFKSKLWLKLTPLYNFYFKQLLKAATYVFIPTQYSKKSLIQKFHLPPDKVIVLPNGIDNSFFKINRRNNNLKKPLKMKKVIYLGRFSKEKNIDRLILAVKKLMNDIFLYIYGSGDEENRLKSIIKETNQIIIKGRLPQTEIHKAYQDAKLMVLPSSNEELPISILEALASGVPVLSTTLPSIKSFFKDRIFYTNGSVEDLAHQISKLIKQNLTSHINKGRLFARQFTWKKFISKLKTYYIKTLYRRYKSKR
ncbi:MAG: glycosyltransferase family 4 protein [Candidatus Helarchaeota archaeon]